MRLIDLLLSACVVGYLYLPSDVFNSSDNISVDNIKRHIINNVPENIISNLDSNINRESDWELVSDKVEATVYNAVPEQCDKDCMYTASMFRLNLNDVYSHRIIAMERTFIKELGLKYGDVVKIEGTGRWDGVWQVQDTMNKKFAGKKKIDILVPDNVKTGKWNNIKLYVLTNKENTNIYKHNMAPQAKV